MNKFEKECVSKGCCFDHDFSNDLPKCYHQIPSKYTYQLKENTNSEAKNRIQFVKNTHRSQILQHYSELGDEVNSELIIGLSKLSEKSSYGGDMLDISLYVKRCSKSVIQVLLRNVTNDDFKISDCPHYNSGLDESEIKFTASKKNNEPLNITIYRKVSNTKLVETIFGPLEYSSDAQVITTRLASRNFYGLGQVNNFEFREKSKEWNLFSKEAKLDVTGTQTPHPFMMVIEPSSKAYGIYFQNSGPLKIEYINMPGIAVESSYGYIDFTVFGGPLPKDVTEQYTSLIGRPSMPPYWGLGYHLCRGSDGNLNDLYR